MPTGQTIQMLETTRKRSNELIDELIAYLRSTSDQAGTKTDPANPSLSGGCLPWVPEEDKLTGEWIETARSSSETYRWPDGNIDTYTEFVSYEGTEDFAGQRLAIGYLANGDAVGFVLGTGTSKRGLTYFFPADDFADSNERVSMIRGGGDTGRGGFAPEDALPGGYQGSTTDVLSDRVAGKWNVQAFVATEDDHTAILLHTALQARLRRLA